MGISAALYSHLVHDATLTGITGDRVTPIDPGDVYPCLSYWCTNTDFERKLNGAVCQRASYYQIDAWATDKVQLETIVERLIVMFGNHIGTMGTTDFKIRGSAVENVFDVPEQMKDASNQKVLHTAVEIHLMFSPQ